MRTLKALFKSEHGVVLAISLLVLTMLIAGGMGAIFSTQMDLNTSSNLRSGRQAFYIAEAGLHQEWHQLDRSDGINEFEEGFTVPGVTELFSPVDFAVVNLNCMAQGNHEYSPQRIKA